jgi:hypothetical protein
MRPQSLPYAAATAALLFFTAYNARADTRAVSANDFLNSIGVNTHISNGLDNVKGATGPLLYGGFRNIRDGGRNIPALITLHAATGVKVALMPSNGSVSITISNLEQLAAAGALLASEGPNEPNNFPVTYQGKTSGFETTFRPVALFQRDLYRAVKSDPKLKGIPVFHSSEAGGAEPDNVGLQFLTIPRGAGTLMPAGTRYADYANCHNYVIRKIFVDNAAWGAESPDVKVPPYDGMYSEYGVTWHRQFLGYPVSQLAAVPKVTTETGWFTQGTYAISEDQQGKLFLNLYLAAFKRGWSYTFIHTLRDNVDKGYWGLFHTDYTPKLSATYLHNLTTILADASSIAPGSLNYSIPAEPVTVHDLLIQKSNGTFELAVWDEKATGTDNVTVNLGSTYATVNVYDPTLGTSPTKTLSNVPSIPLTLSDHPVIIEIPGR